MWIIVQSPGVTGLGCRTYRVGPCKPGEAMKLFMVLLPGNSFSPCYKILISAALTGG